MRMNLDVEPTGSSTATVIFTQEQVDTLRGAAGRSRVPLLITFDEQKFRTSVSIYRGKWMMVVNKQMRDAGLTPGATHQVDIVMDTQARTVEVPADLGSALEEHGLTPAWTDLSYTYQKEHVRVIEEAKRPDTRQRRIDKVIASLQD